MPSYLKGLNRIKTAAPFNQNMLNYGQSKGLLEIDEREVKNSTEIFFAGRQSNKNDNIDQIEFDLD